ncbi:MAG: rhodanese-like domain-containing protein [Allosphingosinicella sp.]
MLRLAPVLLALCLAAPLAPADSKPRAPANPQIDYPGFVRLTKDVQVYRRERLVDWAGFAAAARERDVLILDARSADAFAAGHIEGAVNLPFTDFTDQSLKRVIGRADRPILIYCNNNFSNNQAPVQLKSVRVALNIQTFINLVGYGYRNVRELNEVVDFNDPKVRWVRSTLAQR